MYEIDLLKLSEFFKNEIIVEQRKKIKELEEKLDDEQQHKVRLIMALENDCKSREELEKENEKLKEEKQGLIKDWEEKKNLGYEIACKNEKLKAENEKLKKQVCGLRPELKYIIDKTCCKYNINAKYYHEKIVEIINNLDKYKQALKEIKEIANHCINQDLCTFCNYNDKCYKGFEDEALSYDVCKLILEKISEVENE